jgi:hypothetical protein
MWVPPPTLQLPAPSHVLGRVWVDAPMGHAPGTHCVPAFHLWQAPAPSHVPSLPQVDCAEMPHWPVRSIVPAGRGEHVPDAELSLHVTHGPEQALSQQTPSVEHTRPVEH